MMMSAKFPALSSTSAEADWKCSKPCFLTRAAMVWGSGFRLYIGHHICTLPLVRLWSHEPSQVIVRHILAVKNSMVLNSMVLQGRSCRRSSQLGGGWRNGPSRLLRCPSTSDHRLRGPCTALSAIHRGGNKHGILLELVSVSTYVYHFQNGGNPLGGGGGTDGHCVM